MSLMVLPGTAELAKIAATIWAAPASRVSATSVRMAMELWIEADNQLRKLHLEQEALRKKAREAQNERLIRGSRT